MSICHNDPERSSTFEKYEHEHTPLNKSMFTQCSFDATKMKIDCYGGKDCMKRFCKDLKEHAAKIINHEKKAKKIVIYARKDLVLMMMTKSVIKPEIIVIFLENIEELLIVFVT